MQAHAVLWNLDATESPRLIQEVCDGIDAGLISDASYAFVMRRNPNKFFRMEPDLVEQSPGHRSSLQLTSLHGGQKGYNCAWKIGRNAPDTMTTCKKARENMDPKYTVALGKAPWSTQDQKGFSEADEAQICSRRRSRQEWW